MITGVIVNPIDVSEEIKTIDALARAFNARRLIVTGAKVDGTAVHATFKAYPTVGLNTPIFEFDSSGGGVIQIASGSNVINAYHVNGGEYALQFKDINGFTVVLIVMANQAVPLKHLFESKNTDTMRFLSNYNEFVSIYLNPSRNLFTIDRVKISRQAVESVPAVEVVERSFLNVDDAVVFKYNHFYREWFEIFTTGGLEHGQVLNVTEAVLERKKP